jgi:Bacterial regulatory proteins, tetR family
VAKRSRAQSATGGRELIAGHHLVPRRADDVDGEGPGALQRRFGPAGLVLDVGVVGQRGRGGAAALLRGPARPARPARGGATPTVEIASAAGVTERTFFRHFRAKIDLFLTSFREVAAASDAAMAAWPEGTAPIEVVRAGLVAFAAEAAHTLRIEPDRSRVIWGPELGRTMLGAAARASW